MVYSTHVPTLTTGRKEIQACEFISKLEIVVFIHRNIFVTLQNQTKLCHLF